MPRVRFLTTAVIVAGALSGCGSDSISGGATTATIPITTTAPTTTAPTTTVPTTTVPKTTPPVKTSPVTSAEAEPLHLVGLGDSYPGGLNCAAPCRSYVELLGERAAAALHREVTVDNLATNDSLTARTLLKRVKNDDEYVEALRNADLVTIQVGNNDWQGPCVSRGHDLCLENGRASVGRQLGEILDVINGLRAGKPTAVRVLTYYNASIGDSGIAGPWAFPNTPEEMATFQTWFAAALAQFDDTTCGAASEHGAVCVDVRDAFNGPGHDQDAGALLAGDHFHPSASGHERIADTIAAVGFTPIG